MYAQKNNIYIKANANQNKINRINQITFVDFDKVCISNLNRQKLLLEIFNNKAVKINIVNKIGICEFGCSIFRHLIYMFF